jgi:glycosyltransferase involved in cell wall biosynthesis
VILHVVAGGGLYGMERVLLNLLPALRSRGVPVGALCLGRRGDPLAAVGDALEKAAVPVRYARTSPLAGDASRVVADWRPDAVHTHGYKAAVIGGVLAKRLRRPHLATCHAEAGSAIRHTPGLGGAKLQLYVAMESAALRRARVVAAVSAGIRDELLRRGVSPSRVEVLSNGVRPSPPLSAIPRRFTPQLVIIGRLVEGKNVHTAIEAVAALRRRFPALGLVAAGTGQLRDALASRAAALGIADAIELAGFVADVGALLAASDCMVMPSASEGMPMAILEAMAARVPIVASRVGAIPEMVRHQEEALLVPPGDAAALAAAVATLLEDPQRARSVAEAAHARYSTEFTDEAMAARYQDWYNRHL